MEYHYHMSFASHASSIVLFQTQMIILIHQIIKSLTSFVAISRTTAAIATPTFHSVGLNQVTTQISGAIVNLNTKILFLGTDLRISTCKMNQHETCDSERPQVASFRNTLEKRVLHWKSASKHGAREHSCVSNMTCI